MQAESEFVTWVMRCGVCGKQFQTQLRSAERVRVPNHIASGFGHPCLGALGIPAGVWRKGGNGEDSSAGV